MKSEFKKLRDELFDSNVYDSKGHCNWDKVNELLDNLENKINNEAKEVKVLNPVSIPLENMKDLKSTFDKLANIMRLWETFQEGDDVDLALKQMSKKVDEVNVRFACIELCNKDSEKILNKFTDGFQDNDLKSQSLNVSDFDILQRTIYDIGIAIDLEDSEPIDNDWYGLFNKPKVEPKSLAIGLEPKGEPKVESIMEQIVEGTEFARRGFGKSKSLRTELAPKGVSKPISLTPMGKAIIRDRKIEIIVNTLIDIEIEGVTMEHILERVGMRDQMIKQLSNGMREQMIKELSDKLI